MLLESQHLTEIKRHLFLLIHQQEVNLEGKLNSIKQKRGHHTMFLTSGLLPSATVFMGLKCQRFRLE